MEKKVCVSCTLLQKRHQNGSPCEKKEKVVVMTRYMQDVSLSTLKVFGLERRIEKKKEG